MGDVIVWLAALDWGAIAGIIAIDILLGGDNAIIIALACRNLPAHQRNRGIIWGTVGAIGLRVVLITVAVWLLTVPLLKLAGGLMLLWIGVNLIAPPAAHGHDEIQGSDKLWAAIKTIIVADLVMSVDNVIAIAGAAESAAPSQRLGLIIFGLLVSVPIIVYGSQLVLKMFDRFPFIIVAGGALLGWIGGGLLVSDTWVAPHLPADRWVHYLASAAGAAFVVIAARLIERRRQASSA